MFNIFKSSCAAVLIVATVSAAEAGQRYAYGGASGYRPAQFVSPKRPAPAAVPYRPQLRIVNPAYGYGGYKPVIRPSSAVAYRPVFKPVYKPQTAYGYGGFKPVVRPSYGPGFNGGYRPVVQPVVRPKFVAQAYRPAFKPQVQVAVKPGFGSSYGGGYRPQFQRNTGPGYNGNYRPQFSQSYNTFKPRWAHLSRY